MTGPLSGIRVLDFTWMIAGTMATRPLANLGAEVIKVESRARVDGMRMGALHPSDGTNPNLSAVFNDCNTSKLSIAIDLNQPRGIELAKQLVAISDVVANNFSGTRMARWGLGYEDLRAVKPEVIMIQMPVMGTTGPHRDYRGNGPHVSALVGLNALTGYPGRPPSGSDVAFADFTANPHHGAFALLAALHYRERSGEGQYIDLAQAESTACLLGVPIVEYSATGEVPRRPGNADANHAPHGVYPCAGGASQTSDAGDASQPSNEGEDRWIAISVDTDEAWRALCLEMGDPRWASEERFASVEGRLAASEELDEAVAAWTRDEECYALMERLQAAGIAAGVAQDVRDLVEHDPHWRERQFTELEHPELGVAATHGEPIRLDGERAGISRSPLLGEHTDQVLREVLGLPDDEVDELYLEGVPQ